ncbi:MAG: SBBP repeat-containing protein, partial [Candidatus Sulfotelmatobacter sp.]
MRNSLVWPRALGAMLVLLLTGAGLLGSGSRPDARQAMAQPPASPIPTSFGSSLQSKPPLHSSPDARAILGQLPLIFEPNQGQADPRVKFLARGAGYSLFLDATGAMLAVQTARSSAGHSEQFVGMKLVGANPAAATTGTDALPGKSNYILGNDPRQWHTGIPQFAGARYQSVYSGIDLVFYGNQGRLEYDFRVAPGADPSQAELQFDGATKLELSGGDLILTGKDDGGLRLQAPHVYQRDGERKKPVAGRFVLRAANRVGFEIGPYDHSRELIIDPVLDFSTYFGGSGTETSPSVAVNGNGNIYLAGTTQGSPASSFPDASTITPTLIGPLSLTTSSPPHIFVAEIIPSQPPAVLYETFIGGTGSDTSIGLSVDSAGNAYLVGNTTSTNFPTLGLPYQTVPETKGPQCASISCTSVFVSVLNALGSSLTYSSYLSGNGNDQASGMAIDLSADVFITGTTTSNDTPSTTDAFPATLSPVPYQSASKASPQFFVTKLDTNIPSVGGIAYSTYFGGSTPAPAVATLSPQTGGGIAVDSIGNIYFDGTTNFYNSGVGAYGNSGQTEDFPIVNAYQPCLDTPPPLVLPVANTCKAPATPYPTDAFMAKLNPNAAQTGGTQLLFSTYLGGSGQDTGTAIAIDSGAANIYLTGSTNSPDFEIPVGSAPYDSCLNNANPPGSTAACTMANTTDTDAYVARMTNPTLSTTGTPIDVALNYFSYLGGAGNDSGLAIAVLDASITTLGDAVVTGATSSTNFPVTSFPIQ